MDGANDLPKKRIMRLFEQNDTQEVIISVSPAPTVHLNVPDEGPVGSRIGCHRLLLGGNREFIEACVPVLIEDFYFPIFSADTQKKTFLALLSLSPNGGVKVNAAVIESRKTFRRRILSAFRGDAFSNDDQIIYKLLNWGKLAEQKGISFSANKQKYPLAIPKQCWIVSDPWNLQHLIKLLKAKSPESVSEIIWFQITVIHKDASAELQTKQSEIAS